MTFEHINFEQIFGTFSEQKYYHTLTFVDQLLINSPNDNIFLHKNTFFFFLRLWIS